MSRLTAFTRPDCLVIYGWAEHRRSFFFQVHEAIGAPGPLVWEDFSQDPITDVETLASMMSEWYILSPTVMDSLRAEACGQRRISSRLRDLGRMW